MHTLSPEDRDFRIAFESGAVSPAEFNHRAHIRLAYSYLAEHAFENSLVLMREAIQGFLRRNAIAESKYHETLTRAWLLAVQHFMSRSAPSVSAREFIDRNPRLLDTQIMLTHYTPEALFSSAARLDFLEPDLDPIPEHDSHNATLRRGG